MASIFTGRTEVQKAGAGKAALFGYTRNNGKTWHGGMDVTCPDQPAEGTAVLAVEGGVVTQSRIVNGGVGSGTAEWGNYVTLKGHKTGLYFTYAHLASRTVVAGQSIQAGAQIGVMGNTGNAKGGYRHVHFEVRQTAGGRGINPAPYLGIENAVGIYGSGENVPVTATPTANGQMTVLSIGPMTAGDRHSLENKAGELRLPVAAEENGHLATLVIGPVTGGDSLALAALAKSLALPVRERAADHRLTIGPMSQGDRNAIVGKCDALGLAYSYRTQNGETTLFIGPVSHGDKNTLETLADLLCLPCVTKAE